MYNCPNCNQELPTFVFYCPRCARNIGRVEAENNLIVLWWLDATGAPLERCAKKSLVYQGQYVNPANIFPAVPDPRGREVNFIIKDDDPRYNKTIGQSLLDFFRQATDPTQEWHL